MNVAIMGAGLAGLACAITLERNGIKPVIYERRSRVGDRFVNGEVLLDIMHRPVRDTIASLSDQYHIYLQPTSHIHNMRIFSNKKEAVIEGPLGFTNIRGRDEEAFEVQLSKQVQSEIHFNSEATYEQLLKNYTHVILATGDGEYAKQAKNFREDLTVSIKGATVEGHFDRYTVMAWVDYELAPYGYGYLIPYSDKEANISLAIPDIPETMHTNTQDLWNDYYEKVKRTLGQDLPVTDQFQITKYPMGVCHSPRVGNTFFVGNCFGSMMPFMGFGQYIALLTGIYAAYDLCGFGSFEELTKDLKAGYENSLVLRKAMQQLDNKDLDRIVHLLNGKLGQTLFHTAKIEPLKLASYLLRPYIKMKTTF